MNKKSIRNGLRPEFTPDLHRLIDLIAERVAQKLVEEHQMKSNRPENSPSGNISQKGIQQVNPANENQDP